MARLLRRHTFRRFAEIHLEIRSSRGQIIAGFSCGSVATVRIRRVEVVPPPILPPQVLSSGDIAAVLTNPSFGCSAQEIA